MNTSKKRFELQNKGDRDLVVLSRLMLKSWCSGSIAHSLKTDLVNFEQSQGLLIENQQDAAAEDRIGSASGPVEVI